VKNYIHIIRPINLIIVALSQVLIYYVFLFPFFEMANLVPVLNPFLLTLFILDTVIIAAGGYIVNDIVDYKADLINKPEKTYIHPSSLTIKKAWLFYFTMVIIGLIVAYYIGNEIGKIHLVTIYPIAVLLLAAYSYALKKMPLAGNLVVAIFCVFVPGIIWFAENEMINQLPSSKTLLVKGTLMAYMVFGFLATMAREIIKDIEDMDGDIQSNYWTLPVIVGPTASKAFAQFFMILLIISYFLWINPFHGFQRTIMIILVAVFMLLPSLYISYQIYKARMKADYSKISSFLKYLMILSLVIFLLIPFI